MKILELHFFPGRNIYSHHPVMKMLVDLDSAKDFCTSSDPAFAKRLLQALPGLGEHKCSRRRPGGFVERVVEGTYLGHVIEHVFLELQEQAGLGTKYGKTFTGEGRFVKIISEYRCEQAARILAAAALDLVQAVLKGRLYQAKNAIAAAKEAAARYLPGPSTAAILAAAARRGIPYQQLAPCTSLYRLGTGKYQKRIEASLSERTGCIAVDIACNKSITKKVLDQHGLPVPYGEVAYSVKEAMAIAAKIGFPVAMKPDNGNQGKGVSLNLKNMAEVKEAFKLAATFSNAVIVETYLVGRHYRLLIVNGKLVAAAERIPAHVIGNGKNTVLELVEQENSKSLRGNGHEKPLTKIPLDDLTKAVLQRQGVSLTTVIAAGRRVFLRDNANLSTGGTAYDVTDAVHPTQVELAVNAAKYVGLDIAGVDIVMQNIALPVSEQEGGIIEVNAAPGLRMHLHPAGGESRDVGRAIIDSLFPPHQPVRVPVFSITGTNGKTTITRMLEYVMRRLGFFTGMCCTDGLYYNGEKVKDGDLTGPGGAGAVLAHPEVEVAVLETARGGIVKRGLGYDLADVAVICNVREDHLGQDGIDSIEDLLHVKSLVAEAVYREGTVVLNADEPHVNRLAERVWCNIIYTSRKEDNIIVRRHLGQGGRALFIRRGAILAAQGSRAMLIGRVRDFAATFNGYAIHQTENLLAALAACWGYGLSSRQAGLYLRKFTSSPQDNPGRANLFQIAGVKILVDYGHNPDGFAKMGELIKKMKKKRTLAVVGVPGDRSDKLIVEAGKVAAQYFDQLLIKEDEDLRGRKAGEVAALLKEGALSAGKDAAQIAFFPRDRDAVRAALKMAAVNDLVIIFYEKLEPVLAEIAAWQIEKENTVELMPPQETVESFNPGILTKKEFSI
ncbi:MAG: cyanophycin synthetase [Firmicutes bacterium]|nr:cyanophycin synthetase [Bacillota bacterium]